MILSCCTMIPKSCNPHIISVRMYSMYFPSSKCIVLVQDWENPELEFTLGREQIEVVEFMYLGSCINAGSDMNDEISSRIGKARAVYANLGHL